MASRKDEIVIPDKLYFKIGEVARIVGVKPYVLRYWETEFSEIAPSKSRTKQRLYKRKEVEQILKIRDLLYRDKFTINGARKKLKQLQNSEKPAITQIPLFKNEPPDYSQVLLKIRLELQSMLHLLQSE